MYRLFLYSCKNYFYKFFYCIFGINRQRIKIIHDGTCLAPCNDCIDSEEFNTVLKNFQV